MLELWPRTLQSYRLLAKNEHNSEHVKGSADDNRQSHRWPILLLLSSWTRLLSICSVLVLVSVMAKVLLLPSAVTNNRLLQQQDHMLKLVLPSSEADGELCKTVLTAAILGYPAPSMINYDASLRGPEKQSERDFQRIKMMHEYLLRHSQEADNDIVVLLGSPYNFMQLRPEVLLSRYYRIVDEASNRLRHTISKQAMSASGIEQSVIFAAQRSCSYHGAEQVRCSAVPKSPLTDSNLEYLSTSTMIGPLGALRSLFQRARTRAENTIGDVSFQALFEEIFGEQEYQREAVRQQHWSFVRRAWHSVQTLFGYGHTIIDAIPGHEVMKVQQGIGYEFGIGLDYGNEIGLAVGEGSDKFDWVQWNSSSLLPYDLRFSMPPFWTPTGSDLPSEKGWEDVTLLVHEETGSIPAVITLGWNPSRSLQREGWTNLWMQSNAKALFSEAITIPRLPIASVVDSSKGVERVFWDSEVRFDRAGLKTVTGPWAPWKDICEREETWQPLSPD